MRERSLITLQNFKNFFFQQFLRVVIELGVPWRNFSSFLLRIFAKILLWNIILKIFFYWTKKNPHSPERENLKILLFLNHLDMKEEDLTLSMIQPAWLSDDYFSRYDFFQVLTKIFLPMGILQKSQKSSKFSKSYFRWKMERLWD